MELPAKSTVGSKTSLPLNTGGGSATENPGAVSSRVAESWRNQPRQDGQPRKGPQGRKPLGAVAPSQPGAAPGAPGLSTPGAVSSAPVVDRPLVESLFESIFRGLDDHFATKVKQTGRELVRLKFASESDVLDVLSLSKIKEVELIGAKTAFGAVCEKHGWLGQYVPEAILLALVGKMGAGWFLAQRRLHEIKLAIQAEIKKQQGGNSGTIEEKK